jgi:hypothetical protein
MKNYYVQRNKTTKEISKKLSAIIINRNECESTDNKFFKNIYVYGMIGTASINGEIRNSCVSKRIRTDNNIKCPLPIVVKKIPIDHIDISYKDHNTTKAALTNSAAWSELFFLKLMNKILENKISPHFLNTYDYTLCEKCSFSNKSVYRGRPGTTGCLVLFIEKATYDLKNFLETTKTLKELLVCYMQIFLGLYAMKKYFNIMHHDLHYGNVLINIIPHKTGHVKYLLKNREYKVPCIGYNMMIWDFGLSRIPGKIEPSDYEAVYKKEKDPREDFLRITSMIRSSGGEDYKEAKYIINKSIGKSNNISDIINNLMNVIDEKYPEKGRMVSKFDMRKQL